MVVPRRYRSAGNFDCPPPVDQPDGRRAAQAQEKACGCSTTGVGCRCREEQADATEEYEEAEELTEVDDWSPKRSFGMTISGHRKFMKGLGRGANTTFGARRTARIVGIVGRRG